MTYVHRSVFAPRHLRVPTKVSKRPEERLRKRGVGAFYQRGPHSPRLLISFFIRINKLRTRGRVDTGLQQSSGSGFMLHCTILAAL